MPTGLYMDEHVPAAVTKGLRRRGIDVLRVQDDGFNNTADPIILDHCLTLGRIMVTQDTDFLAEVARRQVVGEVFATVVFFPQEGIPTGRIIADLEYLAVAALPDDLTSDLHYLPL
jgi:hypothetical protein